jgi:hypothetical protein
MKRLVLTAAATLACVAAFAQGRISFQTDSLHLAYFDPSVGGALGGTAVGGLNIGTQPALVADLYIGTSSGSLSLITSTTFSSTSAGKWNSVSITMPSGYPGGSTVFIVTDVHDAGKTGPATIDPAALQAGAAAFGAAHGFSYAGLSSEFTFVLGTSALTVPPMYTTGTTGGGGSSTWPVGTWNLDSTGVTGSRGAIAVFAVPEPGTFALAGLGAAAMLIFRRRK